MDSGSKEKSLGLYTVTDCMLFLGFLPENGTKAQHAKKPQICWHAARQRNATNECILLISNMFRRYTSIVSAFMMFNIHSALFLITTDLTGYCHSCAVTLFQQVVREQICGNHHDQALSELQHALVFIFGIYSDGQ